MWRFCMLLTCFLNAAVVFIYADTEKNSTLPVSLNNPITDIFVNKCIDRLDCFYTGPPFYHPIYRPISLPPSSNLNTEFLFYSPRNTSQPQLLKFAENSLGASPLDPRLDTKILIHGYTVKLDHEDIRFKIKDELLKNNPYNVIIVNWTADNQPPYPQAVANARAVGAQVAQFINYHAERGNLDPKSVHIIGHSLGGHIAGWAGKRVAGLGRITGLDPAGPWFQFAESEARLDPTDADFVDVIHTNGGNIFLEGYGIYEPLGHLDFYPNGGNDQPGCFFEALEQTDYEVNRTTHLVARSCDHGRVNQYFLESINQCHFFGVQCNSYRDFRAGRCSRYDSEIAEMGYQATKLSLQDGKSKFYLLTSEESPYCGNSSYVKSV